MNERGFELRLMNKNNFLLQFSNYLIDITPKYISSIKIYKDELCIFTKKSSLINLIKLLKLHFSFKFTQLIDICGVDYLDKKDRFEVVYNFISLFYNFRIRIKILTNEYEAIPSISSLFSSSLWLEREVWDTYGVFFSNHPDLRRLLTDYGFEGYPFRKDFPQIGFFEIRYDDEKKHVLYEPVELAQEFRLFNFSSPWVQVK